jgi:5-(carboxyamino)imidazole ribonucleotide synthase
MTLVGVLGGGQLGRMLALAGYPLGLRFRVFDPAERPSAGDVATHACGFYDDPVAVRRFAAGLDLCTYEFENVPVETAELVGRNVPLQPSIRALACTQDRLAERELLRGLGVPIAAFAAADALEDLSAALNVTRLPAILKRRRLGYDGRGQAVVRSMCESVQAYAWRQLGGGPAIVETLVPFVRELALIAVRARDGETRFYPLVETRHRDGILRSATAPADVTPQLHAQAQDYAGRILDALRYVGVLTIEFFEHEGALIVNEIAPRVHNSGHWTIEGAETSQFENHLRAIVGLPLGSTAPVGCTALVNLIGVPPDPAAVLRFPDTHLHLYGKTTRPGRKIGHVTVRAADHRTLARRLEDLRKVLPAETKGDTPCDM